jgi:hypothetical protein
MGKLFKNKWCRILTIVIIVAVIGTGGFFGGKLISDNNTQNSLLNQAIVASVNQSIIKSFGQDSANNMKLLQAPSKVSEYYFTYTEDSQYQYQWVTLGNPLEVGAVSFLGNKYALSNTTTTPTTTSTPAVTTTPDE